MSQSFKLSAEDRDLLAHYCSLGKEEGERFSAANHERLAAAYTRVNELKADPSEWLGRRKVTAITVIRVAPQGMTPSPPLSKSDRALLDTYAGLSGNDAIAFFEKHKEKLLGAAMAAAQAPETAQVAAFPPLPPPQPPEAKKAADDKDWVPSFPIRLRLSVVRESSSDALALDLDYGQGQPYRWATIDPSLIVRGWAHTFDMNVNLPTYEPGEAAIVKTKDGKVFLARKEPPPAPKADNAFLRRAFAAAKAKLAAKSTK